MPDHRLLAWGRATACRAGRALPTLWLFTDTVRLPDPCRAAACLPRGRAGVVLRHDDHPERAAVGRALARICRSRRLHLVVAGDVRLAAALRAGMHLRGGRWPGVLRLGPTRTGGRGRPGFVTSSAHGPADLRRAARNGAALVFLSPVFATASHPGEPTWGAVRWSRLVRSAPVPVGALGGITGRNIRRLGGCRAAAAIGALA